MSCTFYLGAHELQVFRRYDRSRNHKISNMDLKTDLNNIIISVSFMYRTGPSSTSSTHYL